MIDLKKNSKIRVGFRRQFPSVGQIEFASKRFKRIYSTNWLGRSPNVYPIPIGLENQGYLQNGVLKDYLSSVPTVMPLKSRPINLLVCFSLHTNLIERSKAQMNALKVPGVYVVERPVTPKRYRDLVGKSRFVLSPPGNGIDCHRTWEALFLGAIPIVKRSFWPFSEFVVGARVVEDWDMLDSATMPQNCEDVFDYFLSKYAKVDSWLHT